MLDVWCGQWGCQFPNEPDIEHWWRGPEQIADECANCGGLIIRKGGYDYYRFGPQGSCKITSIEFRRHGKSTDHVRPTDSDETIEEKAEVGAPPSEVYLMRATRKKISGSGSFFPNNNDARSWYETFEVQTSDGWLMRWPQAQS